LGLAVEDKGWWIKGTAKINKNKGFQKTHFQVGTGEKKEFDT